MDSFFDKLGDTIVTGGKAVGDKARELNDTAKLQIELKRNEDIVMEEYAKLGKKYYEAADFRRQGGEDLPQVRSSECGGCGLLQQVRREARLRRFILFIESFPPRKTSGADFCKS